MAPKLRLKYPGAIYHVMNRADPREPIFQDDPDRKPFPGNVAECRAKNRLAGPCLIIMAELKRRRWTETTLGQRPKGDMVKVKLAVRLRSETMRTVEWLARRLHLGSRAYAHHLLWRAQKRGQS
jgi:hypothetical protein